MKKLAISIALGASIMSFTGVSQVQAQTIDLSQFKQIIELFIALGIIGPDKVDQVRSAFGIPANTPVQVIATSTPIAPIFGISASNVTSDSTITPILSGQTIDFSPTISVNNDNKVVVDMPVGTVSGMFESVSDGEYNRNRNLQSGLNIVEGGLAYRRLVSWTVKANVNGTNYTKTGSFVFPIGKTECHLASQVACNYDVDLGGTDLSHNY